jgi:ACS family glucarate transporter-like MFS transporter
MLRYFVVLALFVLSMITYIDRACISSAKEPIAAELGLDDRAMGLVFSAFALGYALMQVPSGWFADRAGPGIALATVVTAWSALTALTGRASTLSGLVTVRFLFGAAEAGAFPGSVRAIYNWLPPHERGRANGVLFSGSRIGAALSFPLFAWMLGQWHWRTAFGILGAAGIVWVLLWLLWFRDYPAQRVQRDDVPAFAQITIREVFRSWPMALAMTQYFAGNFTFFLCLSWMHPYLMREYRLSNSQAAAYTMAPLLAGALAQWVSGWLVDRLYRSRHRVWSRRVPAMIGFALAAAGIIAVSRVDSAAAAVVCFTVATFGADMTISPSWAFCTDIAGRNSGSVSAAMNMLGNVGSFASANAFPWLYAMSGSAKAYFAVAALLNVVSIACWLRMRSV